MTPSESLFGEPIFSNPFTEQSGPGAQANILREDGAKLLREDGSSFLRE